MKNIRLIRDMIIALSCSSIIVASTLTNCSMVSEKVKKYFDENRIFDIQKVDKMLELWGGDERYVDSRLIPGTSQRNEIYNHFKNKKGQPIVVQYSPSLSDEDINQFNYCFDYFNKIFKVINSDYSFITEKTSDESCDIYVGYNNLHDSKVIAITKPIYNETHSSQIKQADIIFNTHLGREISKSYKRHCMMHELMHAMLGSDDVDESQSQTFSLYNYMDVAFMSSQVDACSEEHKESFVTLLPTDLSTFISLYGDDISIEKKLSYVDLLNSTLENCYEIFGYRQPYYEEDFEIPTRQNIEELENSECKELEMSLQIDYKKNEYYFDEEYSI